MNKPKISELLLGYRKSDRHSLLRALAASALLMALATICKAFLVVSVPMLGVEGQEINFGYTMIMFSGALFGPMWGGLVGLGADFLGFLLDNNGYAYSPGLAVTNIFIGCFSGAVFNTSDYPPVKRLEEKKQSNRHSAALQYFSSYFSYRFSLCKMFLLF